MRSRRHEVRSTIGGVPFRQFLERQRPQQYAITLDQGKIGSDDYIRLGEQTAHRRCGGFVTLFCLRLLAGAPISWRDRCDSLVASSPIRALWCTVC